MVRPTLSNCGVGLRVSFGSCLAAFALSERDVAALAFGGLRIAVCVWVSALTKRDGDANPSGAVGSERTRWGCESLRVTRRGLNGPGLLLYLRDSHPHRARSLGRSAGLLGALPRMRCLGLARRDESLRVLQQRAYAQEPRCGSPSCYSRARPRQRSPPKRREWWVGHFRR
jgi:hypothetical protein